MSLMALMSPIKVLNGKELTPEMREKMMGLQKNLKDRKLRLGGDSMGANIEELLASGAFDRTMIRLIMWMTKGPTDPTLTVEFTDWDKVDEFARMVADM